MTSESMASAALRLRRPRLWLARPTRSTAGGALLVLVVTVLFVVPAIMLVVGAFRSSAPGQPGSWTLKGFSDAYGSASTYTTLKNSLILMASASIIALGFGVFFAWVAARTRTPLRFLITPIMVLGLLLPPLYYGFGWVLLGNTTTGAINKFFADVLGIGLTVNIESFGGLIFVAGLGLVPFAYLVLLGSFRNLDGSFDEAARMAGASQRRALFGIVLPSLAPALIGATGLVMIILLQAFEIPQLIGRPSGTRVFSTEIYRYLYDFTPSRYASANALSLLIVAVVVGIFLVQRKLTAGRSYVTISSKGYRPQPQELGPVRYLFTAIILLFGVVKIVLPIGAVILASLQPIFGVYGRYTLDNYTTVLNDDDLLASLRLTLEAAVIGGALAMVLAFVLAYEAARRGRIVATYLRLGLWIPWALPGVVLALSYLWVTLLTPGVKEIYGTLWLFVIALLAGAIPLASRIAEAALVQVSDELQEAARLSGAGHLRTMVGIVFRLVLPSFFGGWFLCGLFISGNLAIPVVLAGSSARPISVAAYSLYQQGETATAAALFCLVLLVVVAVMIVAGIVRLVLRRRLRRRSGRSVEPALAAQVAP